MDRRDLIKALGGTTAAAATGGLFTLRDAEAATERAQTASQPSDLKITDMRVVRMGPESRRYVIRLDTNQGLHGYGEVRDGASPTYALMLKSRILGMNPCNVDLIFRKVKQFGGPARQAGGAVAIEEACWDLAGKAWGVPCWQMLGGKFRDRIRVYSDTPAEADPVAMGKKLKGRMERGFTFLKMDVSINQCRGVEGALTWPKGGGVDPFGQYANTQFAYLEHPFTGIRITEKGLKVLRDYVATVRDIVGWEVPLASDHYGHFGIEDGIKLARALDPFNLAWLEDMVPWTYTDQYVRLKASCTTPILTGEDVYLKEGFMDLFEKHAISICHPDIATSGGLLETKKIGDLAMEHGISMAMHMAGSPVTLFASVHCAAATENFLVLEHHNVDSDWYDKLVAGPVKPLVQPDGFIPVPDTPGLGVELNEDEVRKHLREGEEYFAPTPEWDGERAWDRLWSLNGPTVLPPTRRPA
jgi:L-alanine-DL-glutamate epimerase-like enolase superfamily enzyme